MTQRHSAPPRCSRCRGCSGCGSRAVWRRHPERCASCESFGSIFGAPGRLLCFVDPSGRRWTDCCLRCLAELRRRARKVACVVLLGAEDAA